MWTEEMQLWNEPVIELFVNRLFLFEDYAHTRYWLLTLNWETALSISLTGSLLFSCLIFVFSKMFYQLFYQSVIFFFLFFQCLGETLEIAAKLLFKLHSKWTFEKLYAQHVYLFLVSPFLEPLKHYILNVKTKQRINKIIIRGT